MNDKTDTVTDKKKQVDNTIECMDRILSNYDKLMLILKQ